MIFAINSNLHWVWKNGDEYFYDQYRYEDNPIYGTTKGYKDASKGGGKGTMAPALIILTGTGFITEVSNIIAPAGVNLLEKTHPRLIRELIGHPLVDNG